MFYALNHGADVINLSLGTSFAYGEWLASMSLEEQALFAENYCIQEGEMWDELFQLFEEERDWWCRLQAMRATWRSSIL